MKTLFFDEAGYTGYNMLDPDQPIFVIASTDLNPLSCQNILTQSFPNYQGNEFKFSNIWRSSNKFRLVNFCSHLKSLCDNTYIWMTNKKFSVLVKMIDFLIEPHITNSGYNFYADGFCWKYANYIYYGLTQIDTSNLYNTLVTLYQDFSRNPTADSLVVLQEKLNQLLQTTEGPCKIFVQQMAFGAVLFEKFHDLSDFRATNEIYFSTMLAIVGHWRQKNSDDFIVVHDASSTFLRQRSIWETITDNEVPRQMHPLGDGSEVEFPLRVISTHSQDSKSSYSIQFCDILAGLASKYFDPDLNSVDKQLMEACEDAGLSSLVYNGIRPQPVFPDQIPPRRLTGPDPVDQMMAIINRKNG